MNNLETTPNNVMTSKDYDALLADGTPVLIKITEHSSSWAYPVQSNHAENGQHTTSVVFLVNGRLFCKTGMYDSWDGVRWYDYLEEVKEDTSVRYIPIGD